MNIDKMTIGEAREIANLFGKSTQEIDNSAWEIGKTYLIRTVTMTDYGTLERVTDNEIVLTNASWIPDTGQFSDALKAVSFSEVEPFPSGSVIIGRGAIIDAVAIENKTQVKK